MTERSQNLKLSRTWNGNTNFNNLGNFGNFGNLFTNQNIGTWYALLGALLLGENEFFGHSLNVKNANTKLQNRMNKESQSKLQSFVTTLPLIKQQNNTLTGPIHVDTFPNSHPKISTVIVKEKSLSKFSQILSLYFLKKISCRQSQCSKKSTDIHLIICISVPLLLAIPVLAGGGGLGALFGNRRQ